MQLFKYLNRKIYILLFVGAFLFFITNIANAHKVISNNSSVTAGEQVTFLSTLTFDGQIGTANGYIDYGDGTAEETLVTNLPVPMSPYSRTYSSSHTYSQKGNYTVRVRTTVTGGALSSGPNPAFMTQRVTKAVTKAAAKAAAKKIVIVTPQPVPVKREIEISRIKLYFENNRPEITLKMNQKAPGLYAKIDYSGSGYFKGYWEIDGKRRGYVSRHLARGPSITLKYPDIPPIPTFKYGTHNVRFVIVNPTMNINFPYGIYFVTSDEKQDEPVVIKLLQPVEGEDIAYNPLAFKWEPVNKSSIYLISIFSKTKEERIFSAYTRQGEYKLRSNILKVRMRPGEQYIWNVVGLNDQNEVTAESIPSAFSFNQETAFLPGQILFVTEPTAQGEKIVKEVKEKYGLEILQTYSIETLGLQVTKFHTDKEIAGIISELKQRKGVVIAQPNYIFKTMSEFTDEPLNELQSIRRFIKIGSDIPFKGRGVTIGVVDTGVDLTHKDLKDAISSHVNCLPDSVYLPEIHGTAVAGLIGARKNNFGIDGYAPESKIFALRACKQISKTQPRGECYSLSIAKALDLGIQNGVQIINMSLGTNVKDKLISKLIDAGSKQGILFVAPAGNNSEINTMCFPASHPKVISVAGLTDKGEFFPNAKVAEKADFYLPCDNLFSTTPDNKHNFLSGTSLSSAVVSGLLALSHEKNKDMIAKRLQTFDGDINDWVNKYLMSKEIATQEDN
ncbi:MAG: S8 family serine peptidase [Desulfobacteraceae bacterium]|nr:S8 family serine peptidase [Desulfobacteraceae bacterium]